MYLCNLKNSIDLRRYLSGGAGGMTGNRNKGKGNGAGPARESQSHCFADQYSKLIHTLLVQTHNMTTVKEIVEQCRRL